MGEWLPAVGPGLRVLHIGGYWRRDNDTVRQMMVGLRQAGCDVVEFCTDQHREALDTDGRRYDRGTTGPVWLRREALDPVIDAHDPHVVICNAGGLAFRPGDATQLRASRRLLGIALSDPAVFVPSTSHIATTFDRFLTNHPPSLARYRALGVPVATVRFGTNPDHFRPALPRAEYRCDVLVMGHAHRDRIEPVRRLDRAFDVHVYGEGWGEHGIASRGVVFGEDSLAALNSAACVIVFDRGLHGDVLIKPSLFDFTAAGALVVTNASDDTARHFSPGREIVTFGDDDDLEVQVHRVLTDRDRTAAIRRAGRERTLRDHTWARAWREMLGEEHWRSGAAL